METPQEPSCWFLCKFCHRGFQQLEKLIIHRKEAHLDLENGDSLKVTEPKNNSRKLRSERYSKSKCLQQSSSTPNKSKRLRARTESGDESHFVARKKSREETKTKSSPEPIQTGLMTNGSHTVSDDHDTNDEDQGSVDSCHSGNNTIISDSGSSNAGPNSSHAKEAEPVPNDEIEFIAEVIPSDDEITVIKRGIPINSPYPPTKKKRLSNLTEAPTIQISEELEASNNRSPPRIPEVCQHENLNPNSDPTSVSVSKEQNQNQSIGNNSSPENGANILCSGPEIYICAHCPRMCSTKASLEKHVQLIHKKTKNPSTSAPIIYDVEDDDDDNVADDANPPSKNSSQAKTSHENHQQNEIHSSEPNFDSIISDPNTIIVTIDENCRVDFENINWKDSEQLNRTRSRRRK